MGLFRRWWRAFHERQTRLAEGVAFIEKMNRRRGDRGVPDSEAGEGASAWEGVFARSDWKDTAPGHDGLCTCCGAMVDPAETVCGQCGAVWKRASARTFKCYAFWVASVSASAFIGYFLKILFEYYMLCANNIECSAMYINYDFVNFVDYYIMISGIAISLSVFTYVFERLKIGPRGSWIRLVPTNPVTDGQDS